MPYNPHTMILDIITLDLENNFHFCVEQVPNASLNLLFVNT